MRWPPDAGLALVLHMTTSVAFASVWCFNEGEPAY
jgi:hypothetical protein